MAMMTAMQTAMAGMETRITQTVKGEVSKQVGIVATDLKEVKWTVQTLTSDMAVMKAKVHDLEKGQASNANTKTTVTPPRKEEILDVVVKGFSEKKTKDILISEIENMVKMIMGGDHNIIVDVPADPCNHGILTFESNANKLEFYKKSRRKTGHLGR